MRSAMPRTSPQKSSLSAQTPQPKKILYVSGLHAKRAKHSAKAFLKWPARRCFKPPIITKVVHVAPYYTLMEAENKSQHTAAELLTAASNRNISLIIKVPEGCVMAPFDTYTETKGEPFLNCYPELLVLKPSDCMHIERDGSTEMSDFRKGYMFSFGRLQPIFPGYGNPHFRNEKCVWRAFLQGKREKIKITPECLYVTNDDLQNFIYENRKISEKQQTSTKCNTPPAFTEAMNKLLITIVETAALTGKPMDIHQLPCTRHELFELVNKLDINLECNSYRTFTSYIQGICAVKKGRPATGRQNPLMKLFPEYYPVKTTHLIEK